MNRTIKPVTGRAVAEFLLKYSMYIVCIGFLIVPSIFFPGFGSLQSITVLLKNISMWGIMAIGVSFVMIIGCNDLSVGLNVSMITVIATILGEKYDLGVIIPAVLVIGILTGAFNGLVVTKLRINPFIATLSTQMIFKGIGLVASGGKAIFSYNEGLNNLFNIEIFRIADFTFTLPMLVLVVCLVIASYVLKYTKFGQSLYVLGGNREAAVLCGINIDRTTLLCYIISGLCAAISGILVASFNTCGNAAIGERYSMQTVAACVLGGLHMTGGYGNAWLAVLGVAAMQLMQKVLYQVDSSFANMQMGFIGAILIIFMIVDKLKIEFTETK